MNVKINISVEDYKRGEEGEYRSEKIISMEEWKGRRLERGKVEIKLSMEEWKCGNKTKYGRVEMWK
jgi:hypothetical protein